jgi:hypothetical protein
MVVAAVFLLVSCRGSRRVVDSHSGRLRAISVPRAECIDVVVVETASQQDVFEPNPGKPFGCWSRYHRLIIDWDAGDRLWIYSGDLGIYVWSRGPSGWARVDELTAKSLAVPGRILGHLKEYDLAADFASIDKDID